MISCHKIFLLFLILTFLTNCQLKKASKSHGIVFLENRVSQLDVNVSNTNDAFRIIGSPHTKSIDEKNNTWFYFESITGKGKYHQLGKQVLLTSNVAVLVFDKFGILKQKKFYKKEDLKNIKFNTKKTENVMTDKSFVEKFLSSIKSKMYGK